MTLKAAWLYDRPGMRRRANAAKYLAPRPATMRPKQAVMTLGGMGYAQEYHVERLFREA